MAGETASEYYQIMKEMFGKKEIGNVAVPIRNTGSEIVIPEGMTPRQVADYLNQQAALTEQEEFITAYRRTFRYRPWDVARAVKIVCEKYAGGMVGVPTASSDPFARPDPPALVAIPVGVNKTEQVPWGSLSLVNLPGSLLELDYYRDPEFGVLGCINIQAPRKFSDEIAKLGDLIEIELASNSIYRGHAIDGKEMAEFLDLSGVDPDKVIYNDDVRTHLEANVWSVLTHTKDLERLGLSLKRAVLLEGPYGTGKTLAAYLTAKIAVENGWTFVYCRPGRDDLREVMATARLYQPAVVMFEDIDTVAGPEKGQPDAVSVMLDIFDGLSTKGTKILSILSTNHANKIHKGMVRPGRLDAVVSIGPLDADKIRELIRVSIPEYLLADEIDSDKVTAAMDGFMPAFVKESIDRTLRYAVARGEAQTVVTTDDFVLAAGSLQPQLDLMNAAPEQASPPAIEVALVNAVHKALKGGRLEYDRNDDYRFHPDGE